MKIVICLITTETIHSKVKDVIENKRKYIQNTIFKSTAKNVYRLGK